MREVVTSTDILTFFRTQSFERLARLVITISADDAHDYRVMKKLLLLAPYNKIYSPDKIVLNLTKTNNYRLCGEL
jgi:hypothetical protein